MTDLNDLIVCLAAVFGTQQRNDSDNDEGGFSNPDRVPREPDRDRGFIDSEEGRAAISAMGTTHSGNDEQTNRSERREETTEEEQEES